MQEGGVQEHHVSLCGRQGRVSIHREGLGKQKWKELTVTILACCRPFLRLKRPAPPPITPITRRSLARDPAEAPWLPRACEGCREVPDCEVAEGRPLVDGRDPPGQTVADATAAADFL